ncbi:MAG: hypothetical protein ACYDBT_06330 [Desulfobulbaceae bacterium]
MGNPAYCPRNYPGIIEAVVNRLLDEDDTSVTLATLARASLAIGVPLKIEFSLNAEGGV